MGGRPTQGFLDDLGCFGMELTVIGGGGVAVQTTRASFGEETSLTKRASRKPWYQKCDGFGSRNDGKTKMCKY